MTTGATRPAQDRSVWRRVRRSPITHVIAAFVVLALVQLFFVKPFQVPSESMSPTLETGDRILADRISLSFGDPVQGDVIVFSRPDTWKTDAAPRGALRTVVGWAGDLVGFGPSNLDALVKRVVGEPGSTVQCCSADGAVQVDGVALDEGYVRNDAPFVAGQLDCSSVPASTRCFGPITVPDGEYLVMGDNRANSADSVVGCRGAPASAECARFVPRSDVIGEVRAILWPLDRAFGPLD